jgi:hypothetical protein
MKDKARNMKIGTRMSLAYFSFLITVFNKEFDLTKRRMIKAAAAAYRCSGIKRWQAHQHMVHTQGTL